LDAHNLLVDAPLKTRSSVGSTASFSVPGRTQKVKRDRYVFWVTTCCINTVRKRDDRGLSGLTTLVMLRWAAINREWNSKRSLLGLKKHELERTSC
jgi:hypothetical protein